MKLAMGAEGKLSAKEKLGLKLCDYGFYWTQVIAFVVVGTLCQEFWGSWRVFFGLGPIFGLFQPIFGTAGFDMPTPDEAYATFKTAFDRLDSKQSWAITIVHLQPRIGFWAVLGMAVMALFCQKVEPYKSSLAARKVASSHAHHAYARACLVRRVTVRWASLQVVCLGTGILWMGYAIADALTIVFSDYYFLHPDNFFAFSLVRGFPSHTSALLSPLMPLSSPTSGCWPLQVLGSFVVLHSIFAGCLFKAFMLAD